MTEWAAAYLSLMMRRAIHADDDDDDAVDAVAKVVQSSEILYGN